MELGAISFARVMPQETVSELHLDWHIRTWWLIAYLVYLCCRVFDSELVSGRCWCFTFYLYESFPLTKPATEFRASVVVNGLKFGDWCFYRFIPWLLLSASTAICILLFSGDLGIALRLPHKLVLYVLRSAWPGCTGCVTLMLETDEVPLIL